MAEGEDRGAGRGDQNPSTRPSDADELAFSSEGLSSRAQVIAEILRLSNKAEPGARISLRLMKCDPEDIELQQKASCSLLHFVPGETWILTASDGVLDAVEEAFGLNGEEPAIEDDNASFDPF